MAAIFKQTYTKPLLANAEIFTRKGRRFARFKNANGRTITASLTKAGNAYRLESRKWYIEFIDAGGKRKRVPGYVDKDATNQKAAELEKQAAREESGLIDRFSHHRKRPLKEHLEDFRKHLQAKNDTPKQVKQVCNRAAWIFKACRFETAPDLSAARVEDYLAERRAAGLSIQTSNHYLGSIKSFTRWLVRDGRRVDYPLVHLGTLNVETDRRHDRRALPDEQFGALIEVTRTGQPFRKFSGSDRAMLYLTAAYTGFRKSELVSLSRLHIL